MTLKMISLLYVDECASVTALWSSGQMQSLIRWPYVAPPLKMLRSSSFVFRFVFSVCTPLIKCVPATMYKLYRYLNMAMMWCFRIVVEITSWRLYFSADGYYYYQWSQCIYTSPDLSDMEFIDGFYFNKYPYLKFNSTVGQFVGFTALGVKNAEMWNKDPSILQQYRAQVEVFCKPNAELMEAAIYNKTGMWHKAHIEHFF